MNCCKCRTTPRQKLSNLLKDDLWSTLSHSLHSSCTAGLSATQSSSGSKALLAWFYLQKLFPHIDKHGTAASEETVKTTSFVTEKCVPKSNTVWEREFLSQQQCNPAESIELRIDLQLQHQFLNKASSDSRKTTSPYHGLSKSARWIWKTLPSGSESWLSCHTSLRMITPARLASPLQCLEH